MNIYTISISPAVSSIHLDDALRPRMLRAALQLISSTIWDLDPDWSVRSSLYQPFKSDTPHRSWCRSSRPNLFWVHRYARHLRESIKDPPDITERLLGETYNWMELRSTIEKFGDRGRGHGQFPREFVNNAHYKKLDFRQENDALVGYRLLLAARWREMGKVSWDLGQKPEWFDQNHQVTI